MANVRLDGLEGSSSVDSLLGRHGGKLLLIHRVKMHVSVLEHYFSGLEVGHGGVGVLHEVLVISIGEVVPGMCASGLSPVEGRVDGLLGLNWVKT